MATLPHIWNYGNYSSSNYGAHTLAVEIGMLRLYFSYDSVIAFKSPKHGIVVSKNVWGTTTGKRLNWIEDDHKQRVPHYQFEDLLKDAIRDLKGEQDD